MFAHQYEPRNQYVEYGASSSLFKKFIHLSSDKCYQLVISPNDFYERNTCELYSYYHYSLLKDH